MARRFRRFVVVIFHTPGLVLVSPNREKSTKCHKLLIRAGEGVLVPLMKYLSLRSVAEYTSLSSRTLRRWVNDPEDPLPAYRVGGKLLFKLEQLEHWLARHQVGGARGDTGDQPAR